MLDLPKHRLVFDLPSSICRRPFFRGQPFPDFLPLLLIFQGNADGFRVFAFGTCCLKRASGTCCTTIHPFDDDVPVADRFLPFIHKHQPFPFSANPLIQFLIVRHVLDSADLFRPRFRLFPVQCVVLDQYDDLLFLAVRVVLLTPTGGIRNRSFRHGTPMGGQLLQMRNEASGIPRPLMHAKSSDELVPCPYLHIISRFELAFIWSSFIRINVASGSVFEKLFLGTSSAMV